LLAAGFLAAAGLWVLSGQFGGDSSPATDAVASAPEPRSVRVIRSTAVARDEAVLVTGQTAASREVEIRAEIDGRVVELPVDRGKTVAPGDVVVRLATDDRAARLEETKALLRQREIEYTAAKRLNERGYRADTALAEAAALLDAARAAVKRMEVEIANTVIAAPFEGVLETRPVELGSYLKASDPIATVVDLDPLKVVGYVTETDVSGIRAGGPGEARLPSGERLIGTVAFVGAVADQVTRTFRVEIDVPNAGGRVAAGLTAEMRLPVGRAMAHRVSPALLSLADDGRVGVKTVDESGTVRFAPIEVLGNADADTIWVGGLPDQATIISVGHEFVRDGDRVRPVLADGTAVEVQS
jgi:multidrug efflux system membrane fusion protein